MLTTNLINYCVLPIELVPLATTLDAAITPELLATHCDRLLAGVDNIKVHNQTILVCPQVTPHVDLYYPPWAVLLILRAGGQIFGTSNHRPPPDVKLIAPVAAPDLVELTLQPSHLLIFHRHSTHWLRRAPIASATPIIAVELSWNRRPAWSQVINHLRQVQSQILTTTATATVAP